MLADEFLMRAGVEADAALRDRAEAFLKARSINGAILRLLPDARIRAYAAHLAEGRPIDYRWLLTRGASPLEPGADLSKLTLAAGILPDAAACPSFVADLARSAVYSDGSWPVLEDVCRAEHAAPLSEGVRARMLAILGRADVAGWRAEYLGDPTLGGRPAYLILAFGDGLARYTAVGAGSGAPPAFFETLTALYDVAQAADGRSV